MTLATGNLRALDETLNAVINLLREAFCPAGGELLPSARLMHDLFINGDDAVHLFQLLHERFGTDFSALGEQWEEFFALEGLSLRFNVIGLNSIAAGFVASVWSGAALRLPAGWGFGLAAAIALSTAFIANRLFPEKPKRPVTVLGLAEIVRNGAWPTDQEMVR